MNVKLNKARHLLFFFILKWSVLMEMAKQSCGPDEMNSLYSNVVISIKGSLTNVFEGNNYEKKRIFFLMFVPHCF